MPLVAPKIASQLSEYTRAVVDGTIMVQGELKNMTALTVYAAVENVDLALSRSYTLKNDGVVQISFADNAGRIRNLRLVGPGTNLTIEGDIPRGAAPMHVTAKGAADLTILKLMSSEVESSGAVNVNASLDGTTDNLSLSGQATVTDGRLRYRSFPHGLERINGPITFNSDRINVDEVRARQVLPPWSRVLV